MTVRAVLGGALVVGVIAAGLVWLWPGPAPDATSAIGRPPNAQPMVVLDVLSGDTVIMEIDRPGPYVSGRGQITARLLGLDSPNFGITAECYAVEAEARLTALLPKGSIAWVTTDIEPKDAAGRWLTYVWGNDGDFINVTLAASGLVRYQAMPPNSTRQAQIELAQTQAMSSLRGLWGECSE